MYTVKYLYNFFKIIENTGIQFKTPSELVNKMQIEDILRLLDINLNEHKDKSVNWLKLAELKITEILNYYDKQSKLIKPLNEKLKKFSEIHEKNFKRAFKRKRETSYNNFIKKDDPLSFEVEINLASKITNGLRLMISALHSIEKPLENTVDMLDATKLINEAERANIIDDMLQYIDESKK